MRPAGPEVLRLDRPLLDWLRSVAGLPVRTDASTPAADARAERLRLAEAARERGYVEGDPPRLTPGLAPALLSLAAPSLVVTAVQSSFGAVGRVEIRAGEVPVVVRGEGSERDYEPRPDLDIAGHLLSRLDLPRSHSTRVGEERGVGTLDSPHPATPAPAPTGPAGPTGGAAGSADVSADPADGVGWAVLSAGAYRDLRGAEVARADELAARFGCPAELVRAVAAPIAEARVEIVSRAGAGLATGPTAVGVNEIAWLDGGPHGLWRLGTAELGLDGEPLAVELRRTTPGELAEELTRAVRDAEGC